MVLFTFYMFIKILLGNKNNCLRLYTGLEAREKMGAKAKISHRVLPVEVSSQFHQLLQISECCMYLCVYKHHLNVLRENDSLYYTSA